MGNVKYEYRFQINGGSKTEIASYQYVNTKGIRLFLSKTGAEIVFVVGQDYSREDKNTKFAEDLIYDGIKRLSLAYYIQYADVIPIDMTRLTIKKGKEESELDILPSHEIKSFVGKIGKAQIPDNLKDKKVIESLLAVQSSKMGAKHAAINAYLYGKNVQTDIEKFIYNWIAFNGFYNSFPWTVKNNDRNNIERLMKEYNLPGTPYTNGERKSRDKDLKKLYANTLIGIKNLPAPYNKKTIEDNAFLFSSIESELSRKGFSVYSYLLCEYAYRLRCDYVHGGKPIFLFALPNDVKLKAFRVVGGLLEEFLDNHLAECFISEGTNV